ncbi:MAG: hypothetical protein ACKOQ6_01805, partial [Bacteroidota bacterium]
MFKALLRHPLLLSVRLSFITLLFTSSHSWGQASVSVDLRKQMERSDRSTAKIALFLKGEPVIVESAILSVGGRVKYIL